MNLTALYWLYPLFLQESPQRVRVGQPTCPEGLDLRCLRQLLHDPRPVVSSQRRGDSGRGTPEPKDAGDELLVLFLDRPELYLRLDLQQRRQSAVRRRGWRNGHLLLNGKREFITDIEATGAAGIQNPYTNAAGRADGAIGV